MPAYEEGLKSMSYLHMYNELEVCNCLPLSSLCIQIFKLYHRDSGTLTIFLELELAIVDLLSDAGKHPLNDVHVIGRGPDFFFPSGYTGLNNCTLYVFEYNYKIYQLISNTSTDQLQNACICAPTPPISMLSSMSSTLGMYMNSPLVQMLPYIELSRSALCHCW
jgi:hypothetical protein